jgi:hypothetical protein
LNTGFWWTEEATQDLLALERDAFMEKYPKVSSDAYRQRLARERQRIEEALPVVLEDNGIFRPADFIYEPSAGVIPEGVERHIMIGDTHGYFVDQAVWAAVLDFIRYFKPHQINCLGDMVDFYDISRFSKNPNRKSSSLVRSFLPNYVERLRRPASSGPRGTTRTGFSASFGSVPRNWHLCPVWICGRSLEQML